MQWVVEGYALFLAALILLGGSLGDHYGRKRMFVLGIAVFAAGVARRARVAPNVLVLDLARCVQGVGGALAVPGVAGADQRDASPARERGRAIGTWSGFASITAAAGPVIGGYLAQHASWRWVFLINLPLALAVLAICWRAVPESRDAGAAHRLDALGALLATLGLGAFTYGLIGTQGGRRDASAVAALAAGVRAARRVRRRRAALARRR